MLDALLSNLTPESIALILGAVLTNVFGSEAMKKGLGKLLKTAQGSTSGLPVIVKRYVLPTVGGFLIAVGLGWSDVELFGFFEQTGLVEVLTDGAVLSVLANAIFRLWKGKPQEA